ncbi:HAD-IA family hydrolase [Terrihabitans soli]|uniref:HAD-IA family hydrolase n=1 Tax=Terrihabitans soli TaxID=708113 RepID=UPI001CA35D6B|nr:HAD-IA family hydrolase [Terrihabitans soli]
MNLVIFDVDGTLIDSQNMIVTAMDRAFAAHGLAAPSRAEVLSIVGLSLETAMRALVKEEADALAGPLTEAYKAAFFDLRQSEEHHEPLFPGALAALDRLSGREDVVLGIATGKSRRGVNAIMDLHNLHGRFATIQTADDHPSKPNPGMVSAAIAETGVLPQRATVIGDTTFDMEMARAAGARAIGVGWGYHPNEALAAAGAQIVLSHFDELDRALEAHFLEEAAR